MARTWDDASTGAVFGDKVNSELYFAENRRNRWTSQGSIKRGNVASGPTFGVTGTGIRQAQRFGGGEQYQGAQLGAVGGATNLISGAVQTVMGARDAWKGYKEQQQADADAAAAPPVPFDFAKNFPPSQMHQINQNLAKMYPPRPAFAAPTVGPPAPPTSMPFDVKTTPAYQYSQINQNLAKLYPPTPAFAAPTKSPPLPPKIGANFPVPQWQPAPSASPPANTRTLNRPWSRGAGWK